MQEAFKDVEVLRHGDSEGNRMIVRLTTRNGTEIHAIAVPQDWPSRTGSTWAYLFESEGLTLVDAGAVGSYPELKEGIEQAGFRLGDIDRLIITHGHADHDGAAGQFVQEAEAEFWAHDIYARLLPYDFREMQRRSTSPLQHEMYRVARANIEGDRQTESMERRGYRARHERYIEVRRGYRVDHGITADERIGELALLHTPGHTPDEICAALDGVVFTGDHVLPEITPQLTMKSQFAPEIKEKLPPEYHEESRLYGLETYVRSLAQVARLGPDVAVLPAHRLFSKGRFNFQSTARAQEIIEHHRHRLGRVLQRIGRHGASLEDVTRGIFERRKLVGGNLYMAMAEVVAHIELLQDTGDVAIGGDRALRWTGSENYRQLISELIS